MPTGAHVSDATWQSMTRESSRQDGSSKGPESSSPSLDIPDEAADDVEDRIRLISLLGVLDRGRHKFRFPTVRTLNCQRLPQVIKFCQVTVKLW